MQTNLEDTVIQLHNCARAIEQKLGQGQLAKDVRHCADRLSSLLKAEIPAAQAKLF